MGSSDNCSEETDLADSGGRHRYRIGVEYGEVGELSCLDRADLVVHLQQVRTAQGDGVQRLLRGDPLLRAPAAAPAARPDVTWKQP